MTCLKCDECEYPTTFGCYDGDYDCENDCNECEETDECKYESGNLGTLVYAFNELVEKGEISFNPFILKRFE